MATRAEVLAAYAANPKASLVPDEEAIKFWQDKGLGNFNQVVDEVRAQNPALAAQIDAQRATKPPVTPVTPVTPSVTPSVTRPVTPAVDNSALYRNLVTQAYGGIGRTGVGTGANQIDQSGYDFWLNALQNGTLTPETFGPSFNRAVGQYVTENPTNTITQNVQAYRPFANTGLLSQSQLQPQSMGAQPVTNYQPQSLAQNFQNYMGIPIGAQYNPAVTAGGASPYSQIKAISPQFVNPYAGTVANISMGGYNPMLYEQVKAADKAAAARAGGSTDYLVDGSGGLGGDGGGGDGGGGGGGGGGCVDPAVLITLADGTYAPAGSIKVGDVLFTMHEKTQEFGAYPVEYVEELDQPKALVLFDDGSNMLVSHSHKFFMVDGEWKQVYQLEPGDTIKAAPGATDKKVFKLEPKGDGPVMKFTVKDAHTYISEGLISHNSKAKGGLITSVFGPNPPGPDDGAVNLDIGEYVIKKSSVDKYGKGLLDMINEGKVPVKKAKSLLF